jgi:hypothetical protein
VVLLLAAMVDVVMVVVIVFVVQTGATFPHAWELAGFAPAWQ